MLFALVDLVYLDDDGRADLARAEGQRSLQQLRLAPNLAAPGEVEQQSQLRDAKQLHDVLQT